MYVFYDDIVNIINIKNNEIFMCNILVIFKFFGNIIELLVKVSFE